MSILLFVRGFIGIFWMFSLYFSLSELPISDATVLIFSAPFFTMIVAHFVIHEPFALVYDGITVLIGFTGVLFVARPEFIFGENPEDK